MVEDETEHTHEHNPNSVFGMTDYPLGSVYSPIQNWRNVYNLAEGFSRGTIFAELFLPFEGESIYKGGIN